MSWFVPFCPTNWSIYKYIYIFDKILNWNFRYLAWVRQYQAGMFYSIKTLLIWWEDRHFSPLFFLWMRKKIRVNEALFPLWKWHLAKATQYSLAGVRAVWHYCNLIYTLYFFSFKLQYTRLCLEMFKIICVTEVFWYDMELTIAYIVFFYAMYKSIAE